MVVLELSSFLMGLLQNNGLTHTQEDEICCFVFPSFPFDKLRQCFQKAFFSIVLSNGQDKNLIKLSLNAIHHHCSLKCINSFTSV